MSHDVRDEGRPALTAVLHDRFRDEAAQTEIATVTIGLGYTAVETAAGDVGLSYTMVERSASCTHVRSYRDYEGQPASELLDLLGSENSLERSMGVAAVNALNRRQALTMPPEEGELESFGLTSGSKVAMVGFFGPVVFTLRTLGVELQILDRDRGIGEEPGFLANLGSWPDLLIITATTILTGAFERFLEAVGPTVKVFVLGPTTPMVPAAYAGFPVHRLGGMVAVDGARVVAAVRQGAGTPVLSKSCTKVAYTFQ